MSVVLVAYAALAAVLMVFEYRVAGHNYGVWWNGLGSIAVVLKEEDPGEAKAPAVYRVLVPWMVGLFERIVNRDDAFDVPRKSIYIVVKWFLMWIAMVAADQMFGPSIALVMAFFWLATFQYDYWDVYAECLGFILVLGASTLYQEQPLWLLAALAGVVIVALSRETWVLLPFVALFASGGQVALFVALAGAFTSLLVRRIQGDHIRYWHRNVISQNLAFKIQWKERGYFVAGWASLLFSVFCLIHPELLPSPFRETFFMPLVIWVVGFVGGFVHEPRIFAPMSLWMGAMLVGRM